MSDDFWTKFQRWKKEQNQFGKQAFAKFMMLNFLDGLVNISDEFVFKGGNLLWHYIKTPRETTDLDLSTLTLASHYEVQEQLKKSFLQHIGVNFYLKEFLEIEKEDGRGAKATIGYSTEQGQANQFKIDIVYALVTDLAKVSSTITKKHYQAASVENIIADKMAAAFKFGSGNTRIKDFDDLWRISKSNIKIDQRKLRDIFTQRQIEFELPIHWAEFMAEAWKAHFYRYKDVPKELEDVFNDINFWLSHTM
jgi:hypothetical protein